MAAILPQDRVFALVRFLEAESIEQFDDLLLVVRGVPVLAEDGVDVCLRLQDGLAFLRKAGATERTRAHEKVFHVEGCKLHENLPGMKMNFNQ
ncbi:hypothetical protein [Bradyrhizobium diversitatis]|uniref:hypothetical protein n=1 Tax=Bradyrhizobium diversitatis TaxID=2755406 RepID=UPI001FE28404|nr:hypothetical protein [Bradyrhizobium diversitatis]